MGTKRKPWLLLSALVLGCAGAGTLSGGVYRGSQTAYRVGPISDGWRRVTVDRQNDLAWQNAAHAAVIHIDSSCDPGLDLPLKVLTNQALIGFTDREFIEQELVAMNEREALRTHVTARLDGVQRELMLQVLKKDGCTYDFGLVAPPGERFAAVLPDFDALITHFETISP